MDSIVVYGNTPCAYLSAVYLRQMLGCKVTMLLPPIAKGLTTIPFAETLSPRVLSLLLELGISKDVLFKHTSAQPCLATQLQNTYADHEYLQNKMLPNSPIGPQLDGIDFHHHLHLINDFDYEKYSLACMLAKANKYAQPNNDSNSIFSSFDEGISIELRSFTQFLFGYAKHLNVTMVNCDDVTVAVNSGQIEHLQYSKRKLKADLFIDCSADRKLVSCVHDSQCEHNSLDEESVSNEIDTTLWNAKLIFARPNPLDASISDMLSVHEDGLLTTHMFSKDICYQFYCNTNEDTPEKIFTRLSDQLHLPATVELRYQHLSPCFATAPWQGNSIAVGDAAALTCIIGRGVISNAIEALARLVELAPVSDHQKLNRDEFNRIDISENRHLHDFQDAYFSLSCLPKSDFYRRLMNKVQSPELIQGLRLFKASGKSAQLEHSPLEHYQWINLFIALGMTPECIHPLLDSSNNQTRTQLSKVKELVASAVKQI